MMSSVAGVRHIDLEVLVFFIQPEGMASAVL